MIDWISALLKALELETVDAELLNHIDDILDWKVVREQNDGYIKLLQEHGEHSVNVRFEELLDRLIVGDFALGEMFPVGLTDDQAKRRYRKLIRIFHPDKGYKSELWLNYRAEKINKAHQLFAEKRAEIAKQDTEPTSESFEPNYQKPKPKPQPIKKKLNTRFKYKPSVWRERLGDPKQFQKKILTILLVVAFSLVGLVYWSNKGVKTSNHIEQLSDISNSHLVADVFSSEGEVSDDYIDDVRAKRILQEADRLLFNQSDLDIEEYNSDLKLISDDAVYLVPGELNDFINEFEEVEVEEISSFLGDVNDRCRDYLDLSSSIVVNDKENKRNIGSSRNLYSGPSKACSLLAVLEPKSEIILFSTSLDDSWVKVISNQNQNLIGWLNMEELKLQKDGRNRSLINEKEVQPYKKIKGVAKVENKNIVSSTVVQPAIETEALSQVHEQKNQLYHEKKQVSSVSVGLNKNKSAIYLMLLEDLKEHYQAGDSQKISNLYINSGRENKIRGAEQIRKYYKKAFKKTTDRKFDYAIESYREEDESTAVVQGVMNLSLKTIKTGVVDKINATFTIWVLKHGEGYKIVSFEWNRK